MRSMLGPPLCCDVVQRWRPIWRLSSTKPGRATCDRSVPAASRSSRAPVPPRADIEPAHKASDIRYSSDCAERHFPRLRKALDRISRWDELHCDVPGIMQLRQLPNDVAEVKLPRPWLMAAGNVCN